MKPRSLTLYNIGPFTGKTHINFDELGDIFLICGKTGSGKTTIFDALTYALYGKISGSRSGLTRMIRSHFVNDEADSYVTLEFSIGGNTWRITRKPPSIQVSARTGTSRDKPEEAVLYRRSKDEWEILTAKLTEVNAYIIRITGLLPEEFSRIVLLPQGEFAEFLRQNSNERRQSLSKLFPVELYGRITDKATEMETLYRNRLQDTEGRIQSLSLEFNNDRWQEESASLEIRIAESRRKHEELRHKILAMAGAIENSRQLYEYGQQREQLQTELAELETQRGKIEDSTAALRNAQAAEKLFPLLQSLRYAQERKTGADELCSQCIQALTENRSEISGLEREQNGIEKRIEENRLIESSLKELDKVLGIEKKLKDAQNKYTSAAAEAETLKQRREEFSTQAARLESAAEEVITAAAAEELAEKDRKAGEELAEAKRGRELSDKNEAARIALNTADETLRNLQKRREELEKAPALLKQEIAELEEALKQAETGRQAAELAHTLADGSPCPVCGSLIHPSPAQDPAGIYFTAGEKIAAKRHLLESAEKEKQESMFSAMNASARRDAAVAAVKETEENYRAVCGNSEAVIPSKEEAAARIGQAAAAKEKSKAALDAAYRSLSRKEQAEKDKNVLNVRINRIQEELHTAAASEAAAKTEKIQLERQLAEIQGQNTSVPPAAQAEQLQNRLKENQGIIDEYTAKREAAFAELSSLTGKKEELEKAKERSIRELEETEKKFKTALYGSAFSDEAELEKALISEEEKKDREEQLESWQRLVTEKKTLLLRLDRELGGKDIPDISAQEEELEKFKAEQDAESERVSEATSLLTQLQDRKKRWDNLEQERSGLAKESSLYVRLAGDLSGNNPKKRSFEAWALGRYLEEITRYASRRLERMSEGRYRLLLNSEKGGRQKYAGLDLEIFDAYTGKKRPCETLSGGETFMASISLALALTDAVQNRSGGIRLDALFIDEGFGSLDETTLETALSILDEIRGTRMVGLISHVQELKNRIPVRIEVTKTSTGSTVTIQE